MIRTIICLCGGRLFRADRDPAGPLRVQRLEPPDEPTPHACVIATRAQAGRLRGPVLVLTDAIQPVVLTLEARTVQGLAPEELTGALAFEAQAFTSIEPEVAAVAWTRSGDDDAAGFWTANLPAAQRDAWEAAIAAQGGHCIGLAHPAGVPRALLANAGSFRRVERWKDLVTVVTGTEAGVRVEIQRTDARRWLDDGVATEHLAGPGMVELDAQPLVALDDDGGLMRWIEAWMAAIEAPAPAAPIIRPPRRPVPTTRIVALAIALGLLMAVAVWLARGAIEARKEATLLALGARQRPVQELADLRKRIAELKPKAEAAAAIRERQREQQRQAMERRRRCLHALASLRGACPPGTSLDEIAVAVDGGRIAGRSTTQEAATRLASTLSASLAQIGCISTPADTRIDGRVRRFTIQWAVPRERAEGEKP